MKDMPYKKWIELHKNPNLRKEFNDILINHWDKTDTLNIDFENNLPLICSEEDFNYKKDKAKSLIYYANDVIKASSMTFEKCDFVIALFDETGCLIKLYGNDKSLKWAKNNNVIEKSIWDENLIGTNAISLGLKLNKSISVIGEENYSKFAINFAVYFSPIVIEQEINDISEYGGIAIVSPVTSQNQSFLFTSTILSRAITWHYYWFMSADLLINSSDGYITIDQSTNRNKIIFISKQTFNLLKTPFKDIKYRNLEQIINSYPENKKFWDIINNNLQVEDTDMNLFISNSQVKINFSTRPFYGKSHHIRGIVLIINSHKRIQNLISRHAGTTANFTFSQIIGKNEKYMNILKQAESIASSNIIDLLLGESGVGKDVIAQSIHNASERKNKPFIAVNCAAFPKDLISSELFGYEDGAFTGAKKGGNIGKFELANEGTIFLDEIGDMPLDLQAVLLRAIEQKSFMKIGSNMPTNSDVRIIAATNKNLKEKVAKGEFREDLFYRLGVIRISIPPLRKRKDDILLLADKFIEKICKRINKSIVTLSSEAKEFLIEYNWPGNVRELQNLLEGIIQLNNSEIITYDHIISYLGEDAIPEKDLPKLINKDILQNNSELNQKNVNNRQYLPNTNKEDIIKALELNKYNKVKTAKYLGISRNTLYIRMKEFNLM